MSMHKKPLTAIEESGLRAHGLDIGAPSQLSDVFRHGVAWALRDIDSVEHMQGGANGPTIRLRGFINAQTGPTAPQPPIDNAFVAEGCEQFSPPAQPAPVPCCGKYETCSHACTPRGRWLGRREYESERAEPAKRLSDAVLALNSAWNARKPESEIADALDLCRRLAATPTAGRTE